jgi:hypothetical protein
MLFVEAYIMLLAWAPAEGQSRHILSLLNSLKKIKI